MMEKQTPAAQTSRAKPRRAKPAHVYGKTPTRVPTCSPSHNGLRSSKVFQYSMTGAQRSTKISRNKRRHSTGQWISCGTRWVIMRQVCFVTFHAKPVKLILSGTAAIMSRSVIMPKKKVVIDFLCGCSRCMNLCECTGLKPYPSYCARGLCCEFLLLCVQL